MELIARTDGRTERVTVERDGALYRVSIGERRYEVEARALGSFVKSLLVDGASHETAVFRKAERRWSVGWRGRSSEVEILDPLEHLAEQAHGEAGRQGRQVVHAYMPGRVVSVAVAEGDAIESGASLLVLEAMKMQNEIRAEHSGTVRKVHVAPGQAVEGGDPLVEVE
ncbi:MAG: acetyl-CoA carboxylase biotin carboxyl carrier protein subunit [Acidobacteriota bacterium]